MQLAATEHTHSVGMDFKEFERASLTVLNYPLQDDHRFKCELYEVDTGSSKSVWEADARAALPARAL
jgi:hypothetical protein